MPALPALQSPAGLLALAGLVPLIVLYLVRPEPPELPLPTLRFLERHRDDGGRNPVLERLRRTLLLLLQALVIVLVALGAASPYVTAQQPADARPTVIVLDASASMATETADGTRFARAVAVARERRSQSTTVVVAGPSPSVPLRNGSAEAAGRALGNLAVTAAPGDLRAAIVRARSLATAETRIVVISDFVDGSDWRRAVTATRARGHAVALRQVAGGGGNVGIVDRRFRDGRVVVSVRNFGPEPVRREVTLGGETRTLELQPGDLRTVSFPVPAGGGEVRLDPRDALPTDDVAYVAAPSEPTIDVLLLTNGENRNLRAALSAMDTVDLTVRRPPAPLAAEYDVIVFGQVDREKLLDSTVLSARELARNGGGVVVQAQSDLGQVGYGDLLPVEPRGFENGSRVATVRESRLTRGFDFPAPESHVVAEPSDGRALVTLSDGSPVLATGTRGAGRVLYSGYVPDRSSFRYQYRYPLFWDRAISWVAGRPPLAERNRATGTRVSFPEERTVDTPSGSVRTDALVLADAGFYATGDGRTSASLLSPAESNVTVPAVDTGDSPGAGTREDTTVRRDLTPVVILLGLAALLGEVGLLWYRGDL